jgi:hypothetical protein
MTDPDRNKKRQTLMEGFNNVPKILDEARRVMDEVTQPTASQKVPDTETPLLEKTGAKPVPPGPPAKTDTKTPGPRRPKPTSETKEGKKRIPKKAPPETSAAPAPPAPDRPRAPLRTLDYYGIRIRHRLYGRIRLRIRKMKYNPALAERIKRGLNDVKGICEVEASAATGSLLVIFDPREMAAPQSRRDFSTLIQGFFPGLDTETLIRKFL